MRTRYIRKTSSAVIHSGVLSLSDSKVPKGGVKCAAFVGCTQSGWKHGWVPVKVLEGSFTFCRKCFPHGKPNLGHFS